ncbi:MAG: sigma-70 family RNA polymerase sigma factor [Planctomycetota bacterium]
MDSDNAPLEATGRGPGLEDLLAQLDWVKALARRLVRDADLAEDLAQETWVMALRRPPASGENLRGWFATLLRRRARAARREDDGRAQRERTVSRPEATGGGAELAARAAAQRLVTDAVLELDEVYRDVLLLRWYEGLPPRDIAARLGAPVATVNTRLQRAHAKLRELLVQRHGGEGWLSALAPLCVPLSAPLPSPAHAARAPGANPSAVSAPPAALATSAVGAELFFLAFAVALSVVLVGAYWTPWRRAPAAGAPTNALGSESGPAGRAAAPRAAIERTAAASPSERDVAPATAQAVERADSSQLASVAVAPAALPTHASNLMVVSIAGAPLAGLRVRWPGPNEVRWQAGDPYYASGPDGTLVVSLAEQDRLMRDPLYASELLGERAHLSEWRATLLGEALPARERTSDAEGRVRLDMGELTLERSDLARLDVVSPGWRAIARVVAAPADCDVLLIAARTRPLDGVVVDALGAPLDGAEVSERALPAAAFDKVLGLARVGDIARTLAPSLEAVVEGPTNSVEGGRFRLRNVRVGAQLTIRAPGFLEQTVTVPPAGDLSVQLQPVAASEGLCVLLVDDAGAPVRGGVQVGELRAATDAEGRAQLIGGDPAAAFVAWAAGYAPVSGDALPPRTRGAREHVIALSARAWTFAGRILDAEHRPRPGGVVVLRDPSTLAGTYSTAEERAGERPCCVPVDADGRFRLTGLARRPYRIALIDASHALVHELGTIGFPPHVGERPLPEDAPTDYVVPADVVASNVRGRVVDACGEPIPGATVRVVAVLLMRVDGEAWTETLASAMCDSSGAFTMDVVPRSGAYIEVRAAGGASVIFATDDLALDAPLRLTLRVE